MRVLSRVVFACMSAIASPPAAWPPPPPPREDLLQQQQAFLLALPNPFLVHDLAGLAPHVATDVKSKCDLPFSPDTAVAAIPCDRAGLVALGIELDLCPSSRCRTQPGGKSVLCDHICPWHLRQECAVDAGRFCAIGAAGECCRWNGATPPLLLVRMEQLSSKIKGG